MCETPRKCHSHFMCMLETPNKDFHLPLFIHMSVEILLKKTTRNTHKNDTYVYAPTHTHPRTQHVLVHALQKHFRWFTSISSQNITDVFNFNFNFASIPLPPFVSIPYRSTYSQISARTCLQSENIEIILEWKERKKGETENRSLPHWQNRYHQHKLLMTFVESVWHVCIRAMSYGRMQKLSEKPSFSSLPCITQMSNTIKKTASASMSQHYFLPRLLQKAIAKRRCVARKVPSSFFSISFSLYFSF